MAKNSQGIAIREVQVVKEKTTDQTLPNKKRMEFRTANSFTTPSIVNNLLSKFNKNKTVATKQKFGTIFVIFKVVENLAIKQYLKQIFLKL